MIRIELPFLPPSTNHAYVTTRSGFRTLSVAGRRFKHLTKVHIAREHREDLLAIRPNKPYLVLLTLRFRQIENKGWPKSARNRYKHLDGSNFIKLIEDALMESTGVDDSNNLTVIVSKEEGTPEKSIIMLWSLDDEECKIHDLIREHQQLRPTPRRLQPDGAASIDVPNGTKDRRKPTKVASPRNHSRGHTDR